MIKKNIERIIALFSLFFMFFTSVTVMAKESDASDENLINMKRDLLVLMIAYPDEITSLTKDNNGLIYLVMKDGRKVLYDDMQDKNYNQKIYKADIHDTLEDIYPLGDINEVREENRDPGRFRSYQFLGAVYGEGESTIRKNLKNYSTKFGNLQFNSKNAAGDNLKKALDEAYELCKKDSKISNFIYPTSGTFNYRVVQDTGLLSPHSFGIAIDLHKNDSDYWKWVTKEKGSKRIAEYPKELVKVFENNGFVWGGKWAHFDILHFEYRPEIILKAKYFGTESNSTVNWWDGVPHSSEVENYIKIIDENI